MSIGKACKGCPYGNCVTKYHAPPQEQVDLVIISERPQLEEINSGRMFTGRVGQLFRHVLKENGGIPEGIKVYSTPAIRCMAPVGVPVKSEAIGACSHRLREELLIARPRLILAMGATALKALTGQDDIQITKVAGQPIESELGLIYPTVAPAAVERRPEMLESFSAHIRSAMHYLKTGAFPDPGKTKFVVVKEEDVDAWVERLGQRKLLAADIETEGFNPFKRDIIALGICWEKNKVAIFERSLLGRMRPLFAKPDIKWIWHNGKFDTKFINNNPSLQEEWGGLKVEVHHDTMLLHYCLNEVKGTHDLESLAVSYLSADPYEGHVKKYLDPEWGYKYAPKKVLYPYLAKDCDYTWQLFESLMPLVDADRNEGRGKDLKWLYSDLLIPAANFLSRVEDHGIWVNPEAREAAKTHYTQEKERLENKLQELVAPFWDADLYIADSGAKKKPDRFSPSSPKQLTWLIYNRLRLRSSKRYPKNTNETTLLSLEPKHPIVTTLLEYREISKILSTYIEGAAEWSLEYDDGRIHCSYLLHGTMTGRLASRYPNMQNIPRSGPARELYQAPPGKRLLEVDYAAAELRVLAVVSNDKNMLEIFLSGRNLHKEVATELFGSNYNEDQYVRAKAVNFGIPYGRTPHTIAKEHNISEMEAERMINKWLGRFPGAHRFINERKDDAVKGRDVRALTGRIRRFKHVRPEFINNAQNEAVNFPMQSVGSDMTLASGVAMEQTLMDRWGVKIINIVHDSLLFEMDDNDEMMEEVKAYVAQTMLDVPAAILETDVPFIVDFKWGYKWGALKK